MEELEALLSTYFTKECPGAAVIMIHDNKIIHRKGYGLADVYTGKRITTKTIFEIGSVTKHFTATGIMILVEKGRLDYNDRLSEIFPQFPKYAEKITVRHLLHHTSGLKDYEDLFVESGKIKEDWVKPVKIVRSKFEPTADDVIDLLSKQKRLHFNPGEKWQYSNSGYVVLAKIIEEISGRTFPQFMKEEVFLPSGMEHSYVYDKDTPRIDNRAKSYRLTDGEMMNADYTPFNFIYGDGNVNTNADDMHRWHKALCNSSLVDGKSFRQSIRPGKLNDGSQTGYGYGWFISKQLSHRKVHHSGSWCGFVSSMSYFPREKITVAVLSNLEQFGYSIVNIASVVSKKYLKSQKG